MAAAKTIKKVMVVEDDPFLKNIYEVKLGLEGFEVKSTVDGKQALKLYMDFKPDVILLDLMLPGLNGFEILEELKKKKKVKTPIIILSNLGQEEDIKKAKSLGASDYFVKAVTPINQVITKINGVLK